MDQDAAPAPRPGVHTDTTHHAVGYLVVERRAIPDPESLDAADTIGYLDLVMTATPVTDGLAAELTIQTDTADGSVKVTLSGDYSVIDVAQGAVTDLRSEMRPEVTA